MKVTAFLAALAGCTSVASAGLPIVINEVDADTPGSDVLEFVELYDGGVGNTSLDGLILVLFNGSDDQSYLPVADLSGFSTDANGYFVIGSTGMPEADIDLGTGWLQNGADAVALIAGNVADYPNDTPIPSSGIIDALVYDTSDSDDAGLLALLNPGEPQVNENGNGSGSTESNGRCPDGSGGQRNTSTYLQGTPTPGAPNNCAGPPTGACCDPGSGLCIDDQTEADCASAGGVWTEGMLCVDIVCEATPTGACCNTNTGECIDDVLAADCMGPDEVWSEGMACVDVACEGAPTGACCNDITGFCTDDLTEADCTASGGFWVGGGSTCDSVKCQGMEPANLLISELVDATLPGGQPKFVEITNCSASPVDLSVYSIGNYNNGATFLGGGAATPLTGVLASGDSYVFAYAADTDPAFEDVYGLPPSQFAGGGFTNGDDVIALFLGYATGDGSDAILVDVYGELGVDGTGEVWDYVDGFSFRQRGQGPNPVFTPGEWVFGGANSLETFDDVEELALILANTTPFSHTCSPICPDLNGDGTVNFPDLVQVLASWGPCVDCEADVDENGEVGLADLLKVLSLWGLSCE